MDNLLYFPNITIPKTPWLYKSLLYWDKVSVITPELYLKEPDSYEGNHMQELVAAGLVEQIIPMNHIYKIPDYSKKFLEFVDEKYESIKEGYKRRNGDLTYVTRVHIEKIDDLGYELERMGLANLKGGWFYMHRSVANDFMFYLSVLLGEQIDSQPITDSAFNLKTRISIGNQTQRNQLNREGLRRTIINDLFPIPLKINSVSELYDFKQKHDKQLKIFRRHIESELIDIDSSPERFKTEKINCLLKEIKEEKLFISETINTRWGAFDTSTFLQVVPAAAYTIEALQNGSNLGVTGGSLSIAALIYSSRKDFRNNRNEIINRPLAYANIVDNKFRSDC